LSDVVSQLMDRYSDRRFAVQYLHELRVSVDREKARYSTWYEMFPRSCAAKPGQHGTFKDCEEQLSHIAGMGFDTLYFPPIHPVGHTNRKGRNNSVSAGPNDPGTPWAIGTAEGGHKAIHPKLGTIEDFHRLIRKADEHGMEIALDLAFQCSPDHPYVKDHPAWFVWRPDGSIQFAENPPKKYQDIYPLNFESDDWQGLWEELKSVVMFWIEQGISVFRVDNPHTKSFYFWEWLIASVKKDHPDVIFLAEAFTRPIVMYQLAKLGFDQSYTYFAWRNTKWELTQYFTELTRSEVNEFFRPNLWPNTPDILTEYLQFGGRPAFMARLVLAATLGASYGIYGPAFELCENQPREPGSEEYLDSEKYELKHWDIDRPGNLGDFIARVNRIRRENPTLQSNSNLEFHPVDNTELICFSKHTDDLSDTVLVVVNLDPHHVHSGWIKLPLEELKLDMRQPYQVHDLLTEARYLWQGARNYVELDPAISPAHIFRLRRRMRTERDFDYYM
jgi:starch synthase (maltosyl-transferring)